MPCGLYSCRLDSLGPHSGGLGDILRKAWVPEWAGDLRMGLDCIQAQVGPGSRDAGAGRSGS